MARVLMLLENNPYPQDVRVRSEAESLTRAGHRVTVVAPRAAGQSRRDLIAGVRVHRFRLPETPANPLGFVVEYAVANIQLYLAGLWGLFKGAQAVHLHNPPDTLFGVGFIAQLLGRQVIFDHHDLAPELFETKLGPSLIARVLRAFERLTFRSASLVVAANESHRAVATGRGRVPRGRVVVVRNGPPSSVLDRARAARDGILEDPHLLFLGSMESQDGVDDLVPMLALLIERHGLAAVHLTLVGDGSRRAHVAEAAAKAGLSGRVRFTGSVPYAEVPEQLAAVDICIDPAPCTELNQHSTMIKIAEYMAARRPVVAFPLLETRRTAGDAIAYARCGELDSLATAVAGLARDPARRIALADRAYERARSLTWEVSEARLVGAYSALFGG